MAEIKKNFSSYEEVKKWARNFTSNLAPNSVVALQGNLGSGKTSFVKACAPFFQVPSHLVSSPTFSYLNIYEGTIPLYHFDLYRIVSLSDFLHLGFEEYLTKSGICFIEWPEKIASLLPENTLYIHWEFSEKGRKITLNSKKELSFCL